MHELEVFFDLSFIDKSLLNQALTHSSYANEHNTPSNERLEFIGDAVIGLVVGNYLYHKYSHYQEGELTKKRAKHICEAALAEYANACSLGDHILFGQGAEKTGGRTNPSLLADAFEALIGAVYLDKNLEEVYKIVDKVVFPLIEASRIDDFIDYKSHLQELLQSDKRSLVYRIVLEEGPPHQKIFVSQVYMEEILMGEGRGSTKKESEQNAAAMALQKLAKQPNL